MAEQRARPAASLLLMAFNQQATVGAAVRAALSQTGEPIEIVISDDASTDATFDVIQQAVRGYTGPHAVVLNRNPANLGIGAHISRLVELSHGEMLFIAAGDDESLPQRCESVLLAWRAQGCRADLVATALIDIDAEGRAHGTINPSELASLRNAADWVARRPFVVGAAQAWTRRLFEHYGPLPSGVVGEDLIMVFRAIGAGGAFTLHEPLVRYRRGGISRRSRNLHATEVVERLLKSNRAALVELPQLLADARTMGQLPAVEPALRQQLAAARFVDAIFRSSGSSHKLRTLLFSPGVPWSFRVRWGTYACCPSLLAPWFFLKRMHHLHNLGMGLLEAVARATNQGVVRK